MMKVATLLCLTMGLLIAAIAVGIGFPPAPVQAQEEAAPAACPMVSVPLDEGYGVSRLVLRQECGRIAPNR